ncbi:hypothetical protein [Nocardia sp. MW-W600-9]
MMWVFVCAVCDVPISVPLREVPWRSDAELPRLPHLIWKFLPARMMAGTFAVHTYPPLDNVRPDGLRYQGPGGAQYVLNPGDTRDTVMLVNSDDDLGCLGITGSGGANIACVRCRSKVGFRIDDCGTWQETLLRADAVRRTEVPATGTPDVIRYPQVDSTLVDRAQWRHGDPIHDFQRAEIAGPGQERWFGESSWLGEVERAQQDATERLDEPPGHE